MILLDNFLQRHKQPQPVMPRGMAIYVELHTCEIKNIFYKYFLLNYAVISSSFSCYILFNLFSLVVLKASSTCPWKANKE